MKKNQLNKEEEILRDKLNQVEFDFQPDDWTAFQKKLPSSGGNASWLSGKSIIGAAVMVSLTVAWFVSQDDKSIEAPKNKADQVIVINPERENNPKASINKENEQRSNGAEESKVTESPKQDPIDLENQSEQEVQSTKTNESSLASEEKVNKVNNKEDQTAVAEEESAALASESTSEVEENRPAIEAKPIITGLSAPDRVCEGEKFSVGLDMQSELPEGYTIDWYVAGNLLAKDSRISKMELEDKGLNLFKIVVMDPNGNEFQSHEKRIETVILPELDFTYVDIKDPYQDFSAEVKVDPELYQSYQWLGEDEELLAEGAKTILHFDKAGYYDVKLKAKTQNGCLQTLVKPLKIEADFDPLAPNAFSPLNQDNDNDSFMPESFKSRNDRFKMQIMTLDGALVYETNSVLAEWNGKQNNSGQMMPAGQYVWKVVISNAEGKHRTFVGNIRIMP